MDIYEATYTNQNGKIISKTTFEAVNLKEAKEKAQFHKSQTPEIQKAGKVKIVVRSITNTVKIFEKIVQGHTIEINDLENKNDKLTEQEKKRYENLKVFRNKALNDLNILRKLMENNVNK